MVLRETVFRVAYATYAHYPEMAQALIKFWNDHCGPPDRDEGVLKYALFEKAEYGSVKWNRDHEEEDGYMLAGFYGVLIEAGLYREYLEWKSR